MNRTSHMFIVFAVALLPVLGLSARETDASVYTLEECLRLGRERSAAMRIARRERDIGETLVSQVRSDALPHFSLKGTYTRLDELQEIDLDAAPGGDAQSDTAEGSFEVGALNNYEASAEVNQLLFSGGRVRSALRAERSARDFYDRSGAVAADGIARDIRVAFHSILYARAAVAARSESVSNLSSHVVQAALKHEAGTLSEFDLISTRVRLGNEEPALIAARNAYDLARAGLARLLNLDVPDFDVQGELIFQPLTLELERLQRLAAAQRPQIRRMQSTVELRAADVKAAGAGHWPNVRSFFRYTESNPYGFAGTGGDWEGHWIAGVTAQWALWDGGLTGATVREKRLELEKARIQLDDVYAAVRLQVEEAYRAMQYAAEAVAAGEGNIVRARKALEIARNRYESGLGTQLEFADSTVALREARLIRLGALRDYADAVARLQYACGLPDRDLYVEMTTGDGRGE